MFSSILDKSTSEGFVFNFNEEDAAKVDAPSDATKTANDENEKAEKENKKNKK